MKNPVASRITITLSLILLAATALRAQGINDPDFTVGTGADNRVATAVLQSDGKVVIAGNFTSYNGTAINRVARLLLPGTLDGGFTPGTGANGQVNSAALTSTGKIVIGGSFSTYNGTGRNRIAQLNANGTLDAGFVVGTGFNNTVSAVAVQSDDKVIAVGDFTSYNGTGRNRIARLNPDGSLDATFNPGTGANFLLTCVALQADGKILIGGYFNNYNGSTVIALARLNANGSLDGGYNLGGSGMDNAVATISVLPDGKALVGGLFTSYNGTARNRILRTNTDGSLDATFDPGAGANSDVLAIARQSDGAILLGGLFTTFGGSTHNRICRIASNGTVDASWTSGANNAINCLQWMPEGRVVVGGLFTSIAGNGRNRIARLRALCSDNTTVTVVTDGQGAETQWELRPVGQGYAAYTGNGFGDNTETSLNACLATGCYTLRVTDSGGDGITGGGYVLKSQNGDRYIDNTGNFSSGGLSEISGAQGGPITFCVPIGSQRPVFTSRDKLDWVDGEYFVSLANAAVSQVWNDFGSGSPERASTGYDFWFFDPNGGYSFVRSRRHSGSDGFAPANATRACHMKINNWAAPNQIPAFTLMNVRIRPVVLGSPGAWGPAYRFKIDPVRAACPLTKLLDIPGNQYISCGQSRDWGAGNYVHAQPVANANKYQFRFRLLDNTVVVVRSSNNYALHLDWATNPLVPGTTYRVDVRASLDGGATWCSSIPTPINPWGEVCLLTINSSFAPPPSLRMDASDDAANGTDNVAEDALLLWPNPASGAAPINVSITGIAADGTLTLELIDATGRVAWSHTVAVAAAPWTGTIAPAGLRAGLYTLRATTAERHWTSRILVQD